MFYKIIILKKPDNTYYHKKVKGSYVNYYVGYKNQYKHEVVHIVDLYVEFRKPYSLRKTVLKKFISFLQKIEKKF